MNEAEDLRKGYCYFNKADIQFKKDYAMIEVRKIYI